jgi:hypothetical protein
VTELAVATFETELGAALALGQRALTWAETHARPLLASASFTARALVLGALQRADTLQSRSPARMDVEIVRRQTTGTEAQLDGAVLYHALALPSVNALFSDASARTLLNRNLRALLRGYAAAGVPFRYFGTEVLALSGRPVALVGYDQGASGAVLIELLIGLENPCVVRSALKREPPAPLYDLIRSSAPHELLLRGVSGVAERLGASTIDVSSSLPEAVTLRRLEVASLPPCSVTIPLGVVEAVRAPSPRITGDLLVSTTALARVEALTEAALARGELPAEGVLLPLIGAPLDGARPPDLLAALRQACAFTVQS